MKRKLISLSLATLTLIFAVAFGGCGQSAKEGGQNLTLMINKADSEKVYIQRIVDLYEEKTGNKIEINAIENAEFNEKAAQTYASGENLPDLLFCFNNSLLSSLDVAKHFYYMNDEPWVAELTEDVLANCLDSQGNVLGLPFWENSLSGCYYNKAMLDQLGLRPAATQAEFDALCAALKSVGQTPLYWAANSCNWMFQFALDPVFADDPALLEKLNKNQITYADIPAVVSMVEWLDKANRNDWFNADYMEAGWDDLATALKAGDSAFLYVWDTWFDTDFGEAGAYAKEDFALMPVFLGTAEMGTYEGGNLNMLLVNKDTPRLQTALEFLRFCADPENYNAAFDGVSTVTCFKRQTTNIQSTMVTEAIASVKANRRVSTAWGKIIGYHQDDVGAAVLALFGGEVDVQGCLNMMDEKRIARAQALGAAGF